MNPRVSDRRGPEEEENEDERQEKEEKYVDIILPSTTVTSLVEKWCVLHFVGQLGDAVPGGAAISLFHSSLPSLRKAFYIPQRQLIVFSYDDGQLDLSDIIQAVKLRGLQVASSSFLIAPEMKTVAADFSPLSESETTSVMTSLFSLTGVYDVKLGIKNTSGMRKALIQFNTKEMSSRNIADVLLDAGLDTSTLDVMGGRPRASVSWHESTLSPQIIRIPPPPGYSKIMSPILEMGAVMRESPLESPSTSSARPTPRRRSSASAIRIPMQQELDMQSVTLEVLGMTCASCVASIEGRLNSEDAIYGCKVSLLANRAEVKYNALRLDKSEVEFMINDIGFDAKILEQESFGSVKLSVFGIHSIADVDVIEKEVTLLQGVKSIAVDLIQQTAQIDFDRNTIGIREIADVIQGLGFTPAPLSSNSALQFESFQRSKEIRYWKEAFWTSLVFSLPISVISMIIPMFAESWVDGLLIPGLSIGNLSMLLLSIPVQCYVAVPFYQSAYKAYYHHTYNMDVLIVLGTGISFLYSVLSLFFACLTFHASDPPLKSSQVFFETSTTLITFITLGRYLENMAKSRTSSAICKLLSLLPTDAVLLIEQQYQSREGESSVPKAAGGHILPAYPERIIPTEFIQIHDLIKVVPGETIPADGIVEFGSSEVDESLITGESLPVYKTIGDAVIGGSVNGQGVLLFRTTKVGSESTLSQIISLVTEAQTSKAPIQDMADQVAALFVYVIIILGAVTFVAWVLVEWFTGWIPPHYPANSTTLHIALSMSLSVIVVACPCALGLATPTAVMVGTGVGARLGILIKGGEPLEAAQKITKIIFDKTGTLTMGNMSVVHFELIHGSDSVPKALLAPDVFFCMLGAAQSNSEHPIGKAITRFAKEDSATSKISGKSSTITVQEVEDFISIPGSGIEAKIHVRLTASSQPHLSPLSASPVAIRCGNQAYVLGEGSNLPASSLQLKHAHEAKGHSVCYVSLNGVYSGLFVVADVLKPEAPIVVRALHHMGIQVAMVTGDQEATAKAIAALCGIHEVHSGISPSGKKELVMRFQSEMHTVAAVGDGVNDSASLAQSDIGIAVYGGSDVTLETANIVLMRPDLVDVVIALDLARVIFRRIRLNYVFAVVYNVLMIPLAMGLFTPWGMIMPAMVSGMAMSASSISVVISSLLLKRYKRPLFDEEGRIYGYEEGGRSQEADGEAEDEDDFAPLRKLFQCLSLWILQAWEKLKSYLRLSEHNRAVPSSLTNGQYERLATLYPKDSELSLSFSSSMEPDDDLAYVLDDVISEDQDLHRLVSMATSTPKTNPG